MKRLIEFQYTHIATVLLTLSFLSVIGVLMRNHPYFKAGVRRVPCLDALDEAVRVCAEKGRLIYAANIGDPGTSLGIAQLHCLEYMAEHASRLGVRMLTGVASATANAAIIDAVRQGYIAGGHPERFRAEDHRFYPHSEASLAAHIDMIKGTNAGGVLMGCWPANPVLEAGYRQGAYQIAFAGNPDQSTDHIVIADHTVIAEEGISAGAYISKDPIELSGLSSMDFAKLFMASLIIAFLVLLAAGYKL